MNNLGRDLSVFFAILLVFTGCAQLNQVMEKSILEPNRRVDAALIDPIDDKRTFAKPVVTEPLNRLNLKEYGDGFVVNGKRFVDPEGQTLLYSTLSDTGFVTYLIRDSHHLNERRYIVKVKDVMKLSKPVKLGALVEHSANNVYFILPNGDRLNGDAYHLTSKGIILTRDRSVVIFIEPGAEPKMHPLPVGYQFSIYQKADISYSKHITIEKRLGYEQTSFGLENHSVHEYEISLFNLDTGEITTTFDMLLRGTTEEKRLEHFKNSFYLFNTVTGPISVSLENIYRQVVVRNLFTRQKATAFQREHGISFLKAGMKNNVIWAQASEGFTDKRVDDAQGFLDGTVQVHAL